MFKDYNYAYLYDRKVLKDFIKMIMEKGDVPVCITRDRVICALAQANTNSDEKIEYVIVVHMSGKIND